MSCEIFETQAQNKRYLGDLVDTLLAEAKNEEDMFEDVPFDFRHHRFKRRVEFPETWKLTSERRMLLEQQRERKALEEGRREEAGQIPDGMAIIADSMSKITTSDESQVLLGSQQGNTRARARQRR